MALAMVIFFVSAAVASSSCSWYRTTSATSQPKEYPRRGKRKAPKRYCNWNRINRVYIYSFNFQSIFTHFPCKHRKCLRAKHIPIFYDDENDVGDNINIDEQCHASLCKIRATWTKILNQHTNHDWNDQIDNNPDEGTVRCSQILLIKYYATECKHP